MQQYFVYIDTQALIKDRLNFESKTLSKIKSLAKNKEIQLLSCPIQIIEIKKKISDITSEMFSQVKKIRDQHQISTYHWPELFTLIEKTTPKQLIQRIKSQFADFIEQTKPLFLKHNLFDLYRVFNKYSRYMPPFQNSKKPKEFPDAFCLAAVESWAKEKRQEVYWISADSDFSKDEKPEGRIVFMPSLESFLDHFNMRKALFENVKQAVHENVDWIKKIIKDEINEIGVMTDDFESEVVDYSIIDVTLSGVDILDISSNSAEVFSFCSVTIEAEVEYEDYNSSPWDNEEKQYCYIEHGRCLHKIEVDLPLFCEIISNDDFKTIDRFGEFELNEKKGIAIQISESDYF